MATNTKTLIYVGPTLKGYKLRKYQVFIGGLPEHVKVELERFPQLRQLFVPTAKLVEAEKAIATPGTPINKYYKMAMEE